MANAQTKKIRDTYQPSEEHDKLLQRVYRRYDDMKENPQRKLAEKEWDAAEKAWDQCVEEESMLEDWQAKYYVPMTTGVIEQILSEMVDQSPKPLILPLSSEDKPKATVMKHVFEYTWNTADGDEELENVLKDSLIYGNGFAQEYYWKDRRIIRSLAGKEDDKKPKYNEVEVFEYDDCYMESVSPYELFFDENARSINRGPYKARDAIRRYILHIDTFKEFFKGDVWDPYNAAQYVKPGGDTDYYSYFKPPQDVKGEQVEVLWYWSRIPTDSLIIVANDILVREGPNPYKHKQLPFAMTFDVKRPHKFYHKGEAKLLESIQKELNIMRRMITDRNHLDIDKMWLIGRNETFNEDDTISRPHGYLRVDDPSNYKPIEYGDIPSSVNLTLNEINKDAMRVTGINDRYQVSQTPITATDAAIKKEQMMQTIKAKLRRLEKGFLIDVGRMRIANIIQFYSQPLLEKIVGEKGTQEYERQRMEAMRKGLLVTGKDGDYREQFKEIRLQGKELVPNERGTIEERSRQGYSFFELLPKYFVPAARGFYQIRFEAGSTMPVSESLMIKQTQDAVVQLMPLATAGVGYDPIKLGDELLRSLNKDPEDFKIENEEQDLGKAQDEIIINMAAQENDEISRNRPIPELGTPYATPGHTMIHIAYLKSPKGKELPEQQFRTLYKHTMGEINAQAMRGEVTSLTGQSPNSDQGLPNATQPQAGSSPPFNQEMKAQNPNLIQGGEETEGTEKGSIMTRVFSMLGRNR